MVAASQRAPDNFIVQFQMSKLNSKNNSNSSVSFNITRSLSPNGVDRFYQLLTLPDGSYYNHNSFFRVLPGFVVQFGISGNTTVSNQWINSNIPDDPVVASNIAGTICFATAGPNTRTTQLFINYANNSRLDSQGFSPFGSVIGGPSSLNILNEIDSEYGQNPDQNAIYSQGDSYLQSNFPNLSYLENTLIL
jgi:peptidyl-prolyl cis-trans isomerase A (cyclophilin A)